MYVLIVTKTDVIFICTGCVLVLRLSFDCARMYCCEAPPLCAGEGTNAFWFVHRHWRRANLFCEAPPPLCAGIKNVFFYSSAMSSCVNWFAKCHPPLRLTGGDDELLWELLAPSGLRLLSRRRSRLAFSFDATWVSALGFRS